MYKIKCLNFLTISKHPNELTNYETTNLHAPKSTKSSYHHLPADLSEENIRKEAALVVAQAESHRSKAENGDNIPTFKVRTKRSGELNPKKFHSLPLRKKKGLRNPVSRSVSDAASKKNTKRPSIFSVFNRRSDTDVNQVDRDPRFEDSGGRRLVRSKSDVGSYSEEGRRHLKRSLKDAKLTTTQSSNDSNKQQLINNPLSPILESAQKEDHFADQCNRECRKSDAITESEKQESGLIELLHRSRNQASNDGAILGKDTISNAIRCKLLTLQSKSPQNMHSSQLPAEKLPLTRGVTVNGLAKRLSMERFSPPPTLSGPVFSYIRPNEGITYAQLDHNEDSLYGHREFTHSTEMNSRSPLSEYRSPVCDKPSLEHELRKASTPLDRRSVDQTDFAASQTSIQSSYNNSTPYDRVGNQNYHNRIIIDPSMRTHENKGSHTNTALGHTTICITNSHSPSTWQQLSPRNLSDEDEGLGIEIRKCCDDEYPTVLSSRRTKSSDEPPIVPIIRSVTPTDNSHSNARAYRSPGRDEPMDAMGIRRTRLESRMLTRCLDRNEQNFALHTSPDGTLGRYGYKSDISASPDRNSRMREESIHNRYLSPEREREPYGPRFHKMEIPEILKKYSPERSHLDIIAPITTISPTPEIENTLRHNNTKYYDDGQDGMGHVPTETQSTPDYEPNSLESQFTNIDQYRSSPENMKRYDMNRSQPLDWCSRSLNRNELQQQSFDKGDSGIENDYRKESFNGDFTSRWRKRTIADDIIACEEFLRRERSHIDQTFLAIRKENYIYREPSIDDGSHYDPRLNKHHTKTNTLRRKDQKMQSDTLKRNKKLGGFEKVKQLFMGVGAGEVGKSRKKIDERKIRGTSSITTITTNNSAPATRNDKPKVKDKDRLPYGDQRGVNTVLAQGTQLHDYLREPKATDISMRRRLSTPKASPLLRKRTSSDKPKEKSPLVKPGKTSWFKSLDRGSRSKSKEKLNVSLNGSSTMKRSKHSKQNTSVPPISPKNLRFFGDTDLDSNPPTITKANSTPKTRPLLPSSTLNRSQKYSKSVYYLDRLNGNSQQRNDCHRTLCSARQTGTAVSRQKSSSMHSLENGDGELVANEVDFHKLPYYSRSRDLDDISESGSETEEQNKRLNRASCARTLSRERLDGSHWYDDDSNRRSNELRNIIPVAMTNLNRNSIDAGRRDKENKQMHHLMGPPKPTRIVERLASSYSRERDRFPAESSGTEGESSLNSQRSVVYLHATTVGAIPQPYHLRRRSISRDDLRSNKSKSHPLQPMTRTVSRSLSMLAPWKPKFISEGYEINYSQEPDKRKTMPRKPHTNSSSTLTHNSINSEIPNARSLRRTNRHKDDQSSLRPSSTTSASKSVSHIRSGDGRRKLK